MAKPKPRVRVPKKAKKGDIVTIKTLISHKMETGNRKGKDGNKIPRLIINKFVANFNGKQVFASDWHPAVSANPYMEFNAKVNEPGTFKFTWVDDDGSVYETEKKITIE